MCALVFKFLRTSKQNCITLTRIKIMLRYFDELQNSALILTFVKLTLCYLMSDKITALFYFKVSQNNTALFEVMSKLCLT